MLQRTYAAEFRNLIKQNYQYGRYSPSPPAPAVCLVSKRRKQEKHTCTEHGSQPAEIIHLDICACILLEGEIGERRRARYEGGNDGQQKAEGNYKQLVCACACKLHAWPFIALYGSNSEGNRVMTVVFV